MNDPFNLERFVTAQEESYESALSELKLGEKRSHWMWYIFPQIDGLGSSFMANKYAIKSLAEAQAYLSHPTLGTRLRECTTTVLAIEERSALEIFSSPDNKKLKSSMTLFAQISEPDSIFERVLNKFFEGDCDPQTLNLLKAH
ncbi:calpastatin [Prochlorothrix hollandica PCC 9006 = CALU 1027]|uniref:Calpastatin n=2 Tax=Prochlorothrix hollandica TaxID=1223 RepID=A0A0M2PW98_PROHO|nr:calpastatin [Prochlorothrix hollandica PCC 9006 = CALU 1027]